MYLSFYGLNEKPFNLTPDANFLYPSKIHREVLGHLVFGINNRKGFICVTGEVGAGKTTLCRVLLNQVDEKTEVAFVLNSYLTEFELLKTINEDLGIATTGRTRKELIDELNKFLLERRSEGKNIVVIIDEAQNLSIPVLEQLRMLSNLETEKEKLLQIILVGQPELNDLLQNEKIRQLNQRITVRHHISPLSRSEVKEYIYYRLNVAGSRGDIVFTKSAVDEVYRYSRGIPRAINVISDQALLVGYVANSRRITGSMVRKAVKEVWGAQKKEIAGLVRHKVRSVAAKAFLGMAIVAMLTFTSFFFLDRIKGRVRNPTVVEPEHRKDVADTDLRQVDDSAPDIADTAMAVDDHQAAEDPQNGAPEVSTVSPTGTTDEQRSLSLMFAALDSGGGMLLGKELNAIDSPIISISSGSPTVVDEDRGPVDGDSGTWATELEATVDLLRLWQVEERYVSTVQARFDAGTVDPVQVANIAALGYIVLNTELETLESVNLPAVAELKSTNGERRFIVIAGLNGSKVRVIVASRKTTLDIDELKSDLTGNMVIYSGNTFVNPTVLRPGMDMSLDVRRLQDYLKELRYFDGNRNGWFTAETNDAVLKFQSDNNLNMNGEVTGYVKLLIYSRLPNHTHHVPRLKR